MRDDRVEQVYREVAESRGEAPDAVIWAAAVRDNWVAEYLNDEISLEELIVHLDRSHDLVETLKQVRRDRTGESSQPPVNFRRLAVNQIFGIEAAELDQVAAFRSEWLPLRLLEMDEVEAWILERKESEGPPSVWVTVLADDDGNPLAGGAEGSEHAAHSRHVKFVVPGKHWIRSEPVNATGALMELATVASMLHRRYDWSEAWAATFILTGVVPPAIVANSVGNQRWPWTAARRSITITVRLDVQPTQLVTLYREKRKEMLRDEPMPRAISEHKALLAIFAARHSAGFTWGETMRRWNKQNPERQFKSEAQFTKDCRDAFNRVMGEPLRWQGKVDRHGAD